MTIPFYGRTGEWTDAELRADIALCRKVLADGAFNGFPLDSETEVEWRDWLSDFENDAEMRSEGRYEPSADESLPISNAA